MQQSCTYGSVRGASGNRRPYRDSEPALKAVSTPATPMRVETVAAAETDWPSTYEATGTVRAGTTATISSKLMGYAREVRAQIGDHVRAGQPLAVLDARDLDTSVARAEA